LEFDGISEEDEDGLPANEHEDGPPAKDNTANNFGVNANPEYIVLHLPHTLGQIGVMKMLLRTC